jgi:hypothetical protein
MTEESKPPLIYTIERSGTNFISYAFSHIFVNPISTHNKNKKFTNGEDIDYKDYDVFATIRDPKEIIISDIYVLYEENFDFSPSSSEIVYIAKKNCKLQENYLNDLIENKNFYIMPFEYFTKDTYKFFIKFSDENNFSDDQKQKIQNFIFFKDPLGTILQDKRTDKKRYPRVYKEGIREYIKNSLELEDMPDVLNKINKLYNILLKRYEDGQINRYY